MNFKDQQPLPNPFQNRNQNWRFLHLKLEKILQRLKSPFFKHYNNVLIQLPSKISKLILCHQMISTVGPKFLSLRLFLLCVTPERKSTRRPLRPPQFGAAWQKHHTSPEPIYEWQPPKPRSIEAQILLKSLKIEEASEDTKKY